MGDLHPVSGLLNLFLSLDCRGVQKENELLYISARNIDFATILKSTLTAGSQPTNDIKSSVKPININPLVFFILEEYEHFHPKDHMNS